MIERALVAAASGVRFVLLVRAPGDPAVRSGLHSNARARGDIRWPAVAGGDGVDELFVRARDSDRRSRARRSVVRRRRRLRRVVVSAAIVVGALAVTSSQLGDDVPSRAGKALPVAGPDGRIDVKGVMTSSRPTMPSASAMRRA